MGEWKKFKGYEIYIEDDKVVLARKNFRFHYPATYDGKDYRYERIDFKEFKKYFGKDEKYHLL